MFVLESLRLSQQCSICMCRCSPYFQVYRENKAVTEDTYDSRDEFHCECIPIDTNVTFHFMDFGLSLSTMKKRGHVGKEEYERRACKVSH